jgi:XTP/dITP diphosphohydrolase
MKIILATENQGKAKEIRELLGGLDIEVLTLKDFPQIVMPPEDGLSFKENALIKARFVLKETSLPTLADDSGLEVDALSNAPGIYSARFAGIDATDEDNNKKLLRELEGVSEEKRIARFRCSLAFVTNDNKEKTFDGTVEGYIAEEPRGTNGFGYDPLFIPSEDCIENDSQKTFGELPSELKQRHSHRARALREFLPYLSSASSKQ